MLLVMSGYLGQILSAQVWLFKISIYF